MKKYDYRFRETELLNFNTTRKVIIVEEYIYNEKWETYDNHGMVGEFATLEEAEQYCIESNKRMNN